MLTKYLNIYKNLINYPSQFFKSKSVPIFIKVSVIVALILLIIFLPRDSKSSKSDSSYNTSDLVGTYVAENQNLGIKQQAELILNKDLSFKATLYLDGTVSTQTTGRWKLIKLQDSIFDFGKLKEIKTNNFLECTENKYQSSSKYKVDLPQITAFSGLNGTTTDIQFGGMITEVPLVKR